MATKLKTESVRWDITNRCNLACLHCYATKKHINELHLSDVLKILRLLHSNGLREVNLSGREPTIRADLHHIIEWCSAHGVTVNMTTNGTLLDKTKLLSIASGVRMLVYSLDGPTSVSHEKIRGTGTFLKTIRSIKICREIKAQHHPHLQIGVSCTLQRLNLHDIPMMIDLCKLLDIDFLVINPITFCGSALRTRRMLQLHPHEILDAWEAICREYSTIQSSYQLYLGTYPMEAKLLNLKFQLDLPAIQNGCSAGKTLYIDPAGEAYPCYMIPPLATAVPEFEKYLCSWKILREPYSHATHLFHSFISFARKHTQVNNLHCTNCTDIKTCRRCPLLALFDTDVIKRCQIAMTRLMSLRMNLKDEMIPMVKRSIVWEIIDNRLSVCSSGTNYTVEKKFEISRVGQHIWSVINGTRSIKDIKCALIEKFNCLSIAEIEICLNKFFEYLWKEGLIGFKRGTW